MLLNEISILNFCFKPEILFGRSSKTARCR